MSVTLMKPISTIKQTKKTSKTRVNTNVNKKNAIRVISTEVKPKYARKSNTNVNIGRKEAGRKVTSLSPNNTSTPVFWTSQFLEDEKTFHQVQPRKTVSPLQPGEIEDMIRLEIPTSGHPAVYLEMDAINRLANDEKEEALKGYIKAAYMEQDNTNLLLKIAYIHILLGKYDKALEYSVKAMEVEEATAAPGAILQSCIYLLKGETVNALGILAGTVPNILARIEFLKKLSQQTDNQVEDWDEDFPVEDVIDAISQQVKQQEAYLVTAMSLEGEAYIRLSCSKRAERSFRAALALRDSHTSSLLGLARAQFLSGETRESCRRYEMLIEQQAENSFTVEDWAKYAYLCSAHRTELDTANACTNGLNATKEDNKHPYFYLLRAEAVMKNLLKPSDPPVQLEGMNKIMRNTVMQDVKRALALNPKLQVAYGVAASCHAETGQYKAAIQYLDKMIGKTPNNAKPEAKLPNWQAQAIATRANILFRLYQSTQGSLKPEESNPNQESLEFLQTITDSLPSNIRNYKSLVAKSPLYKAIEDCRALASASQMHACRGMFGNIVSCVVQDQKKKHNKKSLDKLPLRVKDGSILYM